MKNLLITLIGVVSIGATFPAAAGPDWQIIEQGRKAKLARLQQAATPQAQTSGSSTSGTSQSGDKDAQHEKMMKECMDMMKK